MAGILLVLGAVHPGVVGDDDHHAGVDPGIAAGEQGICRYVEADVLHAAETALACQGCAERGLHGDLFVGRPFGVDLIVLRRFLGDLGAGRAWV